MAKPVITSEWYDIPTIDFVQGERYLPSAFNDSLSYLEKMNKLGNYMNQISGMMNGIGNQWKEIVEWVLGEGLEDAVRDKLEEWLADGTLAQIMSQLIDALPFINLKQYIEANNLTQTEGFQDCLDVAKLLGAVHIIIPGAYTVTTTAELNIYKNTKVELGENAMVKRGHDGYLLLNGVRGTNVNGYEGNGSIKLIGGKWDGNGFAKPATASVFAFGHAKNLIFRDLEVLNANSHSIEMNSSMNVLFDNVKCLGFSTTSENMTAEAIQLDLAVEGGFNAFGAYDATPCKNVTFNKCYFGASGATGTTSVARGIGTHGARVGRPHENIKIDDCVFDGVLDYGIQSYNYRNLKVLNSTFLNSEGGIIIYVMNKDTDKFYADGSPAPTFESCDNFLIQGNKFSGIKSKNHIRIYGNSEARVRNTKILGNTIENAEGIAPPIYALDYDDLNVSDNTIDGVKRYGINAGRGFGFKAKGNTITDCQGSGIILGAGCEDVTVTDNEINEIDFHGILLSDGVTDFTIGNNRLKNVNRANAGYNHIHIVSACTRGTVVGNTTKNGTYQADYSLYVTNTCTDIVRTGNMWKGGGKIRSIYDTGITTAGVDIA